MNLRLLHSLGREMRTRRDEPREADEPVAQPVLDTTGTRSKVVCDRQGLSSMLQDVAESSSGGGVLLWGLGFPMTFA